MSQNGSSPRGPRCIALVGPFQSGKTTLLEAILARTGAIQRQGTTEAGTTVGDASKEARHHKMSVEASVATATFMGDSYTFIDCPGSIEFIHDMRAALPAIDAAVVVCEADEKKVPQLQLILRELEDLDIPHFLFLNKIDKADRRVRETLKLLQPASRVPLVLRQIPIWHGDIISGFVDLALERAFVYKEHAPSEIIELKGEDADRKKEARFTMLETLADHDDQLMEQLLEDIEPPRDKVFDDLAKELRERIICPVLIGAATRSNGVLRLLKALRHEAPGVAETVARLGAKAGMIRWRWCSRPSSPPMAARCRWRGCSQAPPAMERLSIRLKAKPAGCPACSKSWASTSRNAPRPPPAIPSPSASSIMPRPAIRCLPENRCIPRLPR
jgi:elongation factor G